MKTVQQAVVWLLNAAIAIYVAVCLYFIAFGKVNTSLLGVKLVLEDLLNPLGILVFLVILRLVASPRFRKPLIFSAGAGLISLAMFSLIFLLGEGYIRHFHKKSVTPYEETYNDKSMDEIHWKGPVPPKDSKRPLIMVQGDSITWGVGVGDWKLLYPNLLLEKLNKGSAKYDMLTFAKPGMEIDWHGENLALTAGKLHPEIIIYQWYINDIEISKLRPPLPSESWKDKPFFNMMAHTSFLYVWLVNRLDSLLAKAYGTDYHTYLTNRYGENTKYWQEFLFYFHTWANRAQSSAKRVILFMYPCVPYAREYPFADINNRIVKLAGPHTYTIAATYMGHNVGNVISDSSLKFGDTLMASPKDAQGYLLFGPYLPSPAGESSATFWLRSRSAIDGEVAQIDVASGMGQTVHASMMVNKSDFAGEDKWNPFTLKFNLDKFTQDLEFRVYYKGNGFLYADRVEIPVKYNIEVVDMLPHLSGFDTHATLFDSHPNAKAHAAIADALYNKIIH
ncbi:MAG: SGNH/GDSL hydrolase family protein [Nitrospinae bacterium]|nr:SGNH/GDSL hydrolase family protein [Nitrospinota bacterium]MBF0634118.1 SGNH/GDSL hydrolase family protein [Nitrospinota bacterium]